MIRERFERLEARDLMLVRAMFAVMMWLAWPFTVAAWAGYFVGWIGPSVFALFGLGVFTFVITDIYMRLGHMLMKKVSGSVQTDP